MTVYGIANKLLFIFFAGILVAYIPFLLYRVPIMDIDVEIGDIFLIGILTALYSQPIFETFRFYLKEKAEIPSILLGSILLIAISYFFPFYIQEYKMLKADNISITEENLDTVRKNIIKQGKDVIFIEKDNYYILIDKESNKPVKVPYISKDFVKPVFNLYGFYEIKVNGNKFLLSRDFERDNVKLAGFWFSVIGTYLFFLALNSSFLPLTFFKYIEIK